MLNNSQGSQGNNDLQTAQNAIAILIDQISKARGVGRTIVIDKNWLNNQLSALQNSLPAAVHQAQAVLKEKETTLSRAQQEAEMQRQTAADDAQRLKAQAEKEAAAARAAGAAYSSSFPMPMHRRIRSSPMRRRMQKPPSRKPSGFALARCLRRMRMPARLSTKQITKREISSTRRSRMPIALCRRMPSVSRRRRKLKRSLHRQMRISPSGRRTVSSILRVSLRIWTAT